MRRSSRFEAHCSLLLVLSASALVAAACHDGAGPAEPVPSHAAARAVASAAPVVVVWPEELSGWSFEQEPRGVPCADPDRCRLVAGPGTPPIGDGSLMLAASRASGTAAQLHGLGGVRLDRLRALRYSTWHDSREAGENAVVAMEVDVDYDLAGPAQGDVGRLVFEPAPSAVRAGEWQAWDARAGLWWSTRGAARAGAGPDGHPCVRSQPCTWAELLARFPRAGVAADGGVRLAARRGPASRTYVDSVVVGLDGTSTTYDFEAEARRQLYPLARLLGDGVLADRLPADSLFRAGSVVEYAFSSRPGRDTPVVILDDTIVLPAAGRLIMDAPHALHVSSDTVYSYATLTPMERTFADLTTRLLTSGDKVAAAQAIAEQLVAQLNGGMAPDLVARAVSVAQHVVIDPRRDSAALDVVDAALAGQDFHFQFDGPDRLSTWTSRGWPAWTDPASATRLVADGASGVRMPAPAGGTSKVRMSDPTPESPRENTRVVYTNGVWTQYAEALSSATLLAKHVYAEPRFANFRTAVTLHYNPTRSEQMKRYDATHPCAAAFVAGASFASVPHGLVAYAACQGVRFATAITSSDLVESIVARFQLELALPPTNDAVVGLARMVAAYRALGSHVLLVGHSEGVIVQAAAVQQLPALERHPLQVAPRCVAVLALAPPTQRQSYPLDEYHLKGLLAMQDIIRRTQPTGWEDVDTPMSRVARDAMRDDPLLAPILGALFGLEIHSVNTTYLSGNVAPMVLARLTTLHRECLPGSGELTLSAAVVPLQQTVTATATTWNQNNRELIGRPTQFGGMGYFFDQLDSTTFRAMVPYDGQLRAFANVTPGLDLVAPVRIPLLRPDFAIRDTPLSEWVAIGAQNGTDGTHSYRAEGTPAPDPWDGTAGSCTKQVRILGPFGAWVDFERRCNHIYTPVYDRADTLPTGRPIVGATIHYTYANGSTGRATTFSYYCLGEQPCIASGYLELNGEVGVVARSAVTTPSLSAALLSTVTSTVTGLRARGVPPSPGPARTP